MQALIVLAALIGENATYNKLRDSGAVNAKIPLVVMATWRDEGRIVPLFIAVCRDADYRSFAASMLLTYAPTPLTVAWCELSQVGSHSWKDAFWSLRYHENPVTFRYLIKVANRDEPMAKWFAYSVALARGWSCLRQPAVRDLDDTRRVSGGGGFPGYNTVGHVARKYLKSLED